MFGSALQKINFAQQIYASRPDHIFLVRGKDLSGRRAWYYVMVDKGKRDAFKSREGIPSLNLANYGRILYSGFGENPPEDIKNRMAEEYDFNEQP